MNRHARVRKAWWGRWGVRFGYGRLLYGTRFFSTHQEALDFAVRWTEHR